MREERQRLVYEVLRRRQRGESIRQISRVLHIARKTIRKVLDAHAARVGQGDDALSRELAKPRAPRPSKLDDYVGRIAELLASPALAGITAQRIFEIIEEEGFEGKYSIVRDHVRKVQPTQSKRAFDPVVTPPGKQAQFDWSPYTLAGCGVRVNFKRKRPTSTRGCARTGGSPLVFCAVERNRSTGPGVGSRV